jgi:predicted metal-dependent hydrolase
MGDDSRSARTRAGEDFSTTDIELIDGRRVSVRLVVNPRARHVSVRIDPTRRIAIATAPSKRHLKSAAEFAAERAGWIARELARIPEHVSLLPGVMAPLRGVMHELVFERGRGLARIEPAQSEGGPPRLVAPAPDTDLFEARVIRFLKSEAKADLTARVRHFSEILGVRAGRVQVKEIRSRWGSCSADGAIGFSWRVILAPPFVLDYLAAHETAHLKEMNHSRRFWAQVKKALPDFERGRKWLDAHGSALHAIGAGAP